MQTFPEYYIVTPHRPAESLEDLWEHVESLPSLETQAIEWFRYLQIVGHQLRFPYQEYFDLWGNERYLRLRSSFWCYREVPLWGLSFCSFGAPPDQYYNLGWLVNILEILYRVMPHDVLVVENLFELFPDYVRPDEYMQLLDGGCLRVRPQVLKDDRFFAEFFRPLSGHKEYRAAGGVMSLES